MTQTATVRANKPKPRRRWPAVVSIVFVLWLSLVAFVDWAMHQSPDKFGRVMKHVPMPAMMLFPFETMWNDARRGSLSIGSGAPDFNLESYD
jgi:hypothetical protein